MVSTKVAAAVVAVVLTSATAAAWAGGAFETPSAGVVDEGEWGAVTEQRTEIVTTVWVDNPNPVVDAAGASATVDYRLELNGVRVADGTDTIPIEQGNQTRELSVFIENERLQDWWVAYVSDGETLRANFRATAVGGVGPAQDTVEFERQRTDLENETPIIDAVERAAGGLEGRYAGADGAAVVEVRDVRATWGSVGEETTTVRLRATIHNPTEESLSASGFERVAATVRANGVRLVDVDASAAALSGVDPDDEIAPGETREVTFAVPLQNDRVDDWFRTHVQNGERTDLEVLVRATVQDPDGGTVTVPEGGTTYTCEMQTGILVDATAATSCETGDG